MNEREVSEIRRRYKPDKNNISGVRGCYVNEKREIVAQFSQSVPLMPEDEAEKFLSILKRTLSGTLAKNLVDVVFSTQQVVSGEEHKLLMALRDSALKDEDAIAAFFARVIEAVELEDNYLILLAHDTYDVPYRSADGERQDDASSDVYSYILCSVCPVKMSKPALSYYIYENEFHSRKADWLVSPPELGFLFPAFDDRAANIYNALFYTRDTALDHKGFVETVFNNEPPMPAAAQKEAFGAILGGTLAGACSYDMVQGLHSGLNLMIEEHKANKETAPLLMTKSTVTRMLQSRGVDEAQLEDFSQQFDEAFGEDAQISPKNIVDSGQMEIATSEVTVRVKPGCGDLVETRVIDGARYILIRAEDEVTLNGIPIHIT